MCFDEAFGTRQRGGLSDVLRQILPEVWSRSPLSFRLVLLWGVSCAAGDTEEPNGGESQGEM